jgi:hypothetical protein
VRVLALGGDGYPSWPTAPHLSSHTKLAERGLPPFLLEDALPCDLLDSAWATVGRLVHSALEPRVMWRRMSSHTSGTPRQGREGRRTDWPR